MQSLLVLSSPVRPAAVGPSILDQLRRRVELLEHRVRVIGPVGPVELRDVEAQLGEAFCESLDLAEPSRTSAIDRVTDLAARLLELARIHD